MTISPFDNLPPRRVLSVAEDQDGIQEALKRPEGAMVFDFRPLTTVERGAAGPLPNFPIVAGSLYYDIGLYPDLTVRFIHASPGSGTRVATVDFEKLRHAPVLRFIVNWSPEETLLSIGEPGKPESVVQANGVPSEEEIQVGSEGLIAVIGSAGVEVRGAIMYVEGAAVLRPTAINTWRDTLEAITLVQSATSTEGFYFEIVSGNLSLSMLVTGYEAYCKARFLELEEEGIVPDFDSLIARFTSEEERQRGIPELYAAEAQERGISPTRRVVESGRIDFQNFQRCNRAYSKAYGLNFGTQLGIQNTVIDFIKQVIRYRHRIVHVSPTQAVLNMDSLPGQEPVFATKTFVSEATSTFDEFIQALHGASLNLRAPGFDHSSE